MVIYGHDPLSDRPILEPLTSIYPISRQWVHTVLAVEPEPLRGWLTFQFIHTANNNIPCPFPAESRFGSPLLFTAAPELSLSQSSLPWPPLVILNSDSELIQVLVITNRILQTMWHKQVVNI